MRKCGFQQRIARYLGGPVQCNTGVYPPTPRPPKKTYVLIWPHGSVHMRRPAQPSVS